MKRFVIGTMLGCAALIIWASRGHSQELPSVGMPTDSMGFLCPKSENVHAFLDKLQPDMDFDQAKAIGKETSCTYMETAGIIKSNDEEYTNRLGDTFAIISITAEDKVYFTWKLMKRGVPS